MKLHRLLFPALTLLFSLNLALADEWQSMFDGKTLDGWKSNEENPGCFTVVDGAIKVSGGRAHLFYVGDDGKAEFRNFEFRAKVMTEPQANAGIYFHTKYQEEGWPDIGYEAQVNATQKDPKKTGSLYAVSNIYVKPDDKERKPGTTFTDERTGLNQVREKAPNNDGEWFGYYIKVQGSHIEIKINGETTVSYTEPADGSLPNPKLAGRKLSSGTFALQAHDPDSTIYFKDLAVKPLPDAKKRPNVVFILTDDQRSDALGCMGHPHLKTPHIDRLAAEGALFKNHFCTTSLCSPSRASILGGLYAHTHGVTNNFTDYPRDLPTFPRQLQADGYTTAYIGKWHMGEDDDSKRPGFDHFITHKGQGKYFDTEFRENDGERKVVEGYYTTVVTDMSIDWMKSLEETDDDQPFLLFLGHKAPHSFYYPEPKYETAFDHVRFPYPESAFELEDNPEWITKRLNTWHGIYGPIFDWRKEFPDQSAKGMLDFENMVRAYLGTLISVDDSVGRIYEYLEETGELDNTLFIFTSDNGILEGEHGMVDKRTAHEGSLRIPLVVRYPDLIEEGTVIDAQTLTLDFASSILEICGAPALPKTQGASWKKLVSEGDDDWRTSWYYEYNYEKQFPYTPNVRALRTDEWKYMRYPHGDGSADKHMAELYNLKDDPEERNNLINDPKHADLVKELRAELDRRISEALGGREDTMPMDEGIKEGLPDKSIR